jgi:hypothetical protein
MLDWQDLGMPSSGPVRTVISSRPEEPAMTEYSDTWGGDGHGASCPCCCDSAASVFETTTYDDDPYGYVHPTDEAPRYDEGAFDDPVFDGTVDDGPAWEQPAWQPVAEPGHVAPEVVTTGSTFVGGHSITDGIEAGGYGSSFVGGHSITDGIEAGGFGSSVVGGHLITDSTQPGGFGGATVGGVTAGHQAYLAANAAIEAEAAQRAALGNAGYLQANGFVGGAVTSDPASGPHPGVLMQQLAQLHQTDVNNAQTVIYGGRITYPYLTE